MRTQILEFKEEPFEEIERSIDEFLQHYDVENIEVVSRENGFLVLVFYEE